MSINCLSCHKHRNRIMVSLSCGHTYCYLCLKSQVRKHRNRCPQCHQRLQLSMNQLTLSSPMISCEHLKYRQHVWLYASAYGPTWWIYDRYNQRVIETAYQDYLRREGAPSTRSQSTQVSMEEIFPTPSSSVTSELSYEPVHFQNPVSEAGARRASFSESESEDEDQYLHLYLFQIGGVEYRLDFDQMKQVNTINVHKFRKIKRFQLETQLGTHELHQHLQERAQVLGVAGLKF